MDVMEEYEILSVIGEGTFGVVKLGKIKENGESVAIKILEKKKIINEDDEERVKREIDILQKVHHINVIKTLKIEEDEDNIYLVMEFCEKGELFNHIVEEQKLEEIEAAYYYYQLINGLECIHHHEVVHRDLKPENLLLSKGYILKIIDFGLSNFFDKTNLLSTPCGSPCYASPEMVSGKKYDGFMIDIWSTGIILYAMLCGYLPFEDPDNEILFQKILKCDAEFPEDLSDNAIDLMQKIMVTNPKERITIPEIKKHPFYLKGKEKFKSLHPNLVNEVEKDYREDKDEDKDKENNNRENRQNIQKEEKEEKKENISSSDEEYLGLKNEKENESNSNRSEENEENLAKNENDFEKFKEFREDISNEVKYNETKKEETDKIIENEKESDDSSKKKGEIQNDENKKEILGQKNDMNDFNVKIDESLEMVNNKNVADIKEKSPNKFKNLSLDDANELNLEKDKLIIQRGDNNKLEEIKEEDNKSLEKKQDNKDINEKVEKKKNIEMHIEKLINNQKKSINKNKKENKNKIPVNSEAVDNGVNINDNIVKKISQKKENNNISEPKKSIENINNNSNIRKLRNKSKEKEKYKEIMDIIENNENAINSQRNQERVNPYNIKFNSSNIEKETKIRTNINNINTNKNANSIMKQLKTIQNRATEGNKNKSDMQKITKINDIINLKNIKLNKDKNIPKSKDIESTKKAKAPKKSDSLNMKKNEIFKEKIIGQKEAKISNNNDNMIMKHFRLTEKELNSRKENINNNITSAKNNNDLKLNAIVNAPTEQDRKKGKNIKTPIDLNYNGNHINQNYKYLGQNKLLYKAINEIRNNSKKENNALSLNIDKIKNNSIFMDKMSTISNSIDKINNNMNKIQKINTYNNTMNHINNNYSQRIKNINLKNRTKISGNNNIKNKKYLTVDNNFTTKSAYNQKTFSKNLNMNKIYSNLDGLYDDQNLNTLPGDSLYSELLYKRKFDQKYEKINIIVNQNTYKNNNIVYQTRSSNDYLINGRTIDDNINKNKVLLSNANATNKKNDNDIIHKKNGSNYLYPNAQTHNKIYTYNNINKTEPQLSLNKGKDIINRPIYIDKNIIKKNNTNNNYISTFKAINSKKMNNEYNINNNPNRRRLDLNTIRKNETVDYLNTNTNENINLNIKNRLNINARILDSFSNSLEKIGNMNYKTNNTISNLDSNINLYSNHGYINNRNTLNNNMINNRNIQPKINTNYINNISSEYSSQRKLGNNLYYNNDTKKRNINILYNTNNKLVKKGIIQNDSQRSNEHNNILIDDKGYIYDTRAKPNNKYLSNFNLNSNIISDKNNPKYNQFNKTQTELLGLYNNKINTDNNQTSYSNYNFKIPNINSNNKRNKNILMNDNNNMRKIIGQNNNRINMNKSELNNNNNIRDYFVNNNTINSISTINKIGNQINPRYTQIINSNNDRKSNKPKVKNNNIHMNINTNINSNTHVENILMNNKRGKKLESNLININNYKEHQNITNSRDKKPLTFISQDFNNELSQHYLTNNNTNDNFHHIKSKNISDSLINNSIENKLSKRKPVEYAKKSNLNLDVNNKNILNNHNIYSINANNNTKKINLFNYKKIIK